MCTALQRLIEQWEARRDMEMALRLGGALLQFWDMSGPWSERQDFLEWERTAPLLFFLARASAVQGDHATAQSLGEEGLALVKEMTDKQHIASSLEGLAGVAAEQGEAIWAARLAGAGESLREIIGTPMPAVDRIVYEHTLAPIRPQLGEKAFGIAWAEGRTMTLEQALMAREPVTMPAQVSSALPAITAKPSPTCPAGLTAREVEVLRLVAQGMTDAQVAEQLVISPRTVNWHLTSIYSKLGVSSRSAATRYAVEQHIV